VGHRKMKIDIVPVRSVVAVAAVIVFAHTGASAQTRSTSTRADAALVIDGIVREVFRSPRQDREDYLVQIEVSRAQADRVPRIPPRVATPTPGDIVYVHAIGSALNGQGQGIAGQNQPAADVRPVVPAERSQVRAYLAPAARGGWEGAGSPWFETTSNVLVEANAGDSPPGAPELPRSTSAPSTPRPDPAPVGNKSALAALGFTGESMNVKGQFVLRVSSVEQGGPAQRSLELAAGADSKPASEVPPVVASAPETPAGNRSQAPAGMSRSLGISAEPVIVGKRTAMKVIRVEPGSPAQTAGIEVGDVLVAANGVPVTGVEVLSAVLHKSGPNLTLTVRDTRTGRDVPVEITTGGPDAANAAPIPADAPTQPDTGRKLGAVTELVFYDINPAVKVTEVEPNSPAARAGIEPGDIIVEANGTPVLHPKTLDELVRKSAPMLKLQVVDPRTNKKTPVDVNLGGG
jgi:serine protease Do